MMPFSKMLLDLVAAWGSTAAGVAGIVCVIVAILSFAACFGCGCNSRKCKRRRRAVRLWPRRIKRGTVLVVKWLLIGIAAFFLLRLGLRLMSWSMTHGPGAVVPPTSKNPYYRPPITLPPPAVPVDLPPAVPAETRFAVAHDHKPQTKKPRKRAQRA